MTAKVEVPPRPRDVPKDLTSPSGAHRLNAWIALVGLLLFVALYVGLTAHFGWTAFSLIRDVVTGRSSLFGLVPAIPAAFFFAFLARGLFVVKQSDDETAVEITADEQPALFAFVHQVADEAGAPRPHRVFLTARVNAAVFYDLSILNLVFPSKKNLELGLGVVEALTLDELKAVVGHELGHFAQRTMAVGRWVYVAQQITAQVVGARTIFDRFLAGLSVVDIRIAWIGWLMRLLVWAIRAVLETAFRGIVLAHRALSREMEFNADAVAVSVSGSDSLIHALHKLGAADDAWSRALRFVEREESRGAPVADFFAVQARVLEHLREALDDPALGQTPARPDGVAPETHRVFSRALAMPPQMWSTHPPNREREDQAKRRYLPSHLDERRSWALFRRPRTLRGRVTRRFLSVAIGPAKLEPVPIEETLARVDEEYDRPILEGRYRGAYLGRSVVSEAKTVRELYGRLADLDRDAALTRLDALYPPTLSQDIERWLELRSEHAMLEGLAAGILEAPGGIIQYRGREIPRRKLTEAVERAAKDLDAALEAVLAHDREARTAHRLAARHVEDLWEDYLVGLAEILHYADHTAANVTDALAYLRHTFEIVIADGRITASERSRLELASLEVWEALEEVFTQREEVALPPTVASALGVESWAEVLPGRFDLARPMLANLSGWLGVVESWAETTGAALGALTNATLEELLRAEARVADALRDGDAIGEAPSRGWVPGRYTTLVTGDERPRQKQLGWWDRFVLADGWLAGTARLLVSSAVLLPVLLFTGGVAHTTRVTVHNGLSVAVHVELGDVEADVRPYGHITVTPEMDDELEVVAETEDGRTIEAFEADASGRYTRYVYNVAQAAALVEWTAVYSAAPRLLGELGRHGEDSAEPRPLGAPRWTSTRAWYVLEPPPRTVETGRFSATTERTVLETTAGEPPVDQILTVADEDERRAMAAAHLQWEGPSAPDHEQWRALALVTDAVDELPPEEERPPVAEDVFAARERYAAADPDQQARMCGRWRSSDEPDAVYLAVRCLRDPEARALAYLEGYASHPAHPWFRYAAGYEHSRHARWDEALEAWAQVREGETASLWPDLVVEVARMRRARAADPRAVDLDDLEVARLESLLGASGLRGDWREGEDEAYRELLAGRLAEAVALSRQGLDYGLRDAVTILVGASEGASREQIDAALRTDPPMGVLPVLFTSIALATREGRSTGELWERARESLSDAQADHFELVLRSDRTLRDAAWLDSRLNTLTPELRGIALSMLVVRHQAQAPDAWRRGAEALLFVPERPWFFSPAPPAPR